MPYSMKRFIFDYGFLTGIFILISKHGNYKKKTKNMKTKKYLQISYQLDAVAGMHGCAHA